MRWVIVWLVVPTNRVSPAYATDTVWRPTVSVVVDQAATPLALIATVARTTPSTMNRTVPLGTPDPGATAVTVAVKVTVVPRAAGLADVRTTARLEAFVTVYARLPLVAALKLPLPL